MALYDSSSPAHSAMNATRAVLRPSSAVPAASTTATSARPSPNSQAGVVHWIRVVSIGATGSECATSVASWAAAKRQRYKAAAEKPAPCNVTACPPATEPRDSPSSHLHTGATCTWVCPSAPTYGTRTAESPLPTPRWTVTAPAERTCTGTTHSTPPCVHSARAVATREELSCVKLHVYSASAASPITANETRCPPPAEMERGNKDVHDGE
eukprot:3550218-Rhodomonas_salina.1